LRVPSSPARELIVAYASIVALLNIWVFLPGGADFGSTASVAAGVAIQALIVWRLWHGSEIAWLFGLGGAVLALLSMILVGIGGDVGLIVLSAFFFAQAVILCTPPLLSFVWSKPARTSLS